ncbi:MarR family winged helix-turn-helix transcriptional regulator [Deinococcus peraridilitoris]|uniref:Transcriptional regulator n=1 Tax=Deinococcus peraridilitoris (strain DSM 19664 / LMG 22246 / CIP 109416 / KR-200) TaxID=937777 RepID=L0A6N9_DEIPD|nr:MarR family transcriptional regulator [Deinococcus peraridilitoris]AFZ69548.1 transcriptional regulator [Deinococcus peraridilitoris DSM 19664]
MNTRTPHSHQTYPAMAAFRSCLAAYAHASERIVRRFGLTPQHYSLLVVLGAQTNGTVTVGEVAQALNIAHHGAVGLTQRAQQAGLIERIRDSHSRRRVLLHLTATGQQRLQDITQAHMNELHEQRAGLHHALHHWIKVLDENATEPA